ncbi:MAG: DciA family protein [Pseudomonadota bacterium]
MAEPSNSGKSGRGPKQVAGLASRIVDPLLAKRVGLTTALISTWPDIVGDDIGAQSRPIRIKWPPKAADGEFQAGTLVVAARAMAALHLQHETTEIIARVNAFMGYTAITAVKIEQRQSVAQTDAHPRRARPLTKTEAKRVDSVIAPVKNERLQEALRKMGQSVLREKRR